MRLTRHRTLVPAVLVLTTVLGLAGPVPAPVYIQSPTETLTRKENRVAVVTAVAPAGPESYRFEVEKALHGDVAGELVVRMESETVARTVAGERYVLGFTDLLPNPQRRGTFTVDPLGPRAVRLDDAGLALIEDTKPTRRLLALAASDEAMDPEQAIGWILEQLVRDEPAARRFAAAELHLRRGLSSALAAGAGGPMDAAWSSSSADPQARYHLLSVAGAEVDTLGADRLARYAREVLDAHGQRLELTSYDPLLVLTAAGMLGDIGAAEDLPRLEKHLYSNNTGIPKAALPSMSAIDPEATLTAVARALSSDSLNPETRRVLEAHLRTAGAETRPVE